jgi:predicted RNA binding protein YcfA (HicA-like mRNA interferase family)
MTAKEVMKKLQENGWTLNRTNGSHYVFTKKGCRPIPVPLHGNKATRECKYSKRQVLKTGAKNDL